MNEPQPCNDSIFVIGTDTDVGKTVVSLLLMQHFYAVGRASIYLKPFQTGCRTPRDANSDAGFVYAHTPALAGQDPAQAVLYCHREPKAPYFAARQAGEDIDIDHVVQQIRARQRCAPPLILEAAGGLLVPVTADRLMIDVLAQVDCRALLVARAGLGTINHTLLSIEALRRRGIKPLGAVLVDKENSPRDLVEENIAAIERFGGLAVGGVIGRIDNFDAPSAKCFEPLRKLLGPIDV